MPAGNYGSCIHQNQYPVQDDEYNYHDSLQARLMDNTGHWNPQRKWVYIAGSHNLFPV